MSAPADLVNLTSAFEADEGVLVDRVALDDVLVCDLIPGVGVDQADRDARDHALPLDASGRGDLRAAKKKRPQQGELRPQATFNPGFVCQSAGIGTSK